MKDGVWVGIFTFLVLGIIAAVYFWMEKENNVFMYQDCTKAVVPNGGFENGVAWTKIELGSITVGIDEDVPFVEFQGKKMQFQGALQSELRQPTGSEEGELFVQHGLFYLTMEGKIKGFYNTQQQWKVDQFFENSPINGVQLQQEWVQESSEGKLQHWVNAQFSGGKCGKILISECSYGYVKLLI